MSVIPSYCMEGNEVKAGGKLGNWRQAYRAINAHGHNSFRDGPYENLGMQHLTNRDSDWRRQPGHNAATPRTPSGIGRDAGEKGKQNCARRGR